MARSAKAEQTRQRIIDAAMSLFGEVGYDATTMRSVADAAGVSVGNAYYYFSSKEQLIQAYYDQIQAEHAAAVDAGLDRTDVFADRLRLVMHAWLDVARPYHQFAGLLFRNAAEPSSPLSPFSADSTEAREASIALYGRAVAGSDLKVNARLRGELPELLWLLQMGVVLFWVHDDSPDQRRTSELIDRVVPLVDRLLRLTRLPVVRGLADEVVGIVAAIKR